MDDGLSTAKSGLGHRRHGVSAYTLEAIALSHSVAQSYDKSNGSWQSSSSLQAPKLVLLAGSTVRSYRFTCMHVVFSKVNNLVPGLAAIDRKGL